jgi:hypothetical protein
MNSNALSESSKKLKLLSKCEINKCHIPKKQHDLIQKKYKELRNKVEYKSSEYYNQEQEKLNNMQQTELKSIYQCASNLCDKLAREYVKARLSEEQKQIENYTKEIDKNPDLKWVISGYETSIKTMENFLKLKKISALDYAKMIRNFNFSV